MDEEEDEESGLGGGLSGAMNPEALLQAIQTNPALLQGLMDDIQQRNPNLHAQIMANPALLQQFIMGLASSAGGPGAGMIPQGSGGNTVQVTPEELSKIERLKALGFTQHQVLEAFLACDRNEEMAANYLFSMAEGDPDFNAVGGTGPSGSGGNAPGGGHHHEEDDDDEDDDSLYN